MYSIIHIYIYTHYSRTKNGENILAGLGIPGTRRPNWPLLLCGGSLTGPTALMIFVQAGIGVEFAWFTLVAMCIYIYGTISDMNHTPWYAVTRRDTPWHAVTRRDTLWHAVTCHDTLWHAVTRSDTWWHAMRLGILNSEPQYQMASKWLVCVFLPGMLARLWYPILNFPHGSRWWWASTCPEAKARTRLRLLHYIVRCLYNHIVPQIQLKILKNWDVVLFWKWDPRVTACHGVSPET